MDKNGILRCGVVQMLSIKVPLLYRRKGIVIMNTHAKYESPISKDKKVMTNLKVFRK